MSKPDDLRKFFQKAGLVEVVDMMAKRYGRTPGEILDLPIGEYNFNMAVMHVSIREENRRNREAQAEAERKRKKRPGQGMSGGNSGNTRPLHEIGLKRKTVKKGSIKTPASTPPVRLTNAPKLRQR